MDDIEQIMKSIEDSWRVRTERMQHDHIGQVDNGVPGCPACESINPMHMTWGYAQKMRFASGGG